jgi:pyruvate dehydrogenase E2 component (dihydrolipoamide acetyltransferase)
MYVLILNCGSSSIKFQIARMPKYNVLVQGRVERIGYDDAIFVNSLNKEKLIQPVAVALPEGLLVPVVKYANVKGLKEISNEIKDLGERAKSYNLMPDELTGGTFTISNLGMYGIESFTPIINQPEVAILGVNAIHKESVVVNDELVLKPMMNLSLTADHRVVDGAVAAEFLAKLKEYIERPGLLLL